jgi:molybdopterin molybdotransferase
MTEQLEKSVAEVYAQVLDSIEPIAGYERIGIDQALGRILAAEVISPLDVPAHDNSAMDGFAIRGLDYLAGTRHFTIAGKALAGQPHHLRAAPHQAFQVTTGAVMPGDCDTVIVQEMVRRYTDATESSAHPALLIEVPDGQVQGQNRRLRGEDLARGQLALKKGRVLKSADLGLLASLGVATVAVKPRLRVAYFSTGDELQEPGQALEASQIYDSNRYTLRGMISRLGFEAIDLGAVRDSPEHLEEVMQRAAKCADVIISSGGVSVGEADYTKTVMATLGKVEFWRIAMRPGRPMAYGKVLNRPYFGLPGNPVAVMVTFYFLARNALLKQAGASIEAPLKFRVRLKTPINKRAGRVEYQRACLRADDDGELSVYLIGQQGSGVLRSMCEANCFIVMQASDESAKVGDFVSCLAFDGLV